MLTLILYYIPKFTQLDVTANYGDENQKIVHVNRKLR